MVIFRVVLMLTAFVLVLILALMNAQNTTVAVVFSRTYYDVPVAFVMLYSFAFGALCVGIFTLVSELGLRARLRRQRKEIENLTDELRALRNAPLEGEFPSRDMTRFGSANRDRVPSPSEGGEK